MLKTGVIIMALFSFLQANWFTDLFDDTPTLPIEVPIDLAKPSKIETKVRIKDRESYYITLEFKVKEKLKNYEDRHEAAKIAKFVGYNVYFPYDGKQIGFANYDIVKQNLARGGIYVDKSYNPDGTTVPIRMTIYKLGKNNTRKLFLDKIYMTKGHNGGGSGGIMRDFAHLLLDKGKYLFKIENLKGFPELKDNKIVFTIHPVYTK